MFKKFATAAILTAAAALPASAQQGQGSTLKATHGAWEVRCNAQNSGACAITQTGNNNDNQPVIQTLIRKTPGLKGPNGQPVAAVVEIIAPIGVFLPAGVAIKIDGREVGRGGYRVCNPQACLVAEPVQEQFIDQFKKGSGAVLTVVGANGDTADIELSLSGFTKAYNSL